MKNQELSCCSAFEIMEAELQIQDRIVNALKADPYLWTVIKALGSENMGIDFNISASGIPTLSIIDREQWKKILTVIE